jgi:hypothetical protein
MNAVWSFWSVPWRSGQGWMWCSRKCFLLSWVLSLETCRKHYHDVALYTDSQGAHLLVDQLGLQFKRVFVTLDTLKDEDPRWWILGKLHTYRVQREPFFHVDYDVYLWKPLPSRLVDAPVFAQNPEDESWYAPDECETLIESAGDSALPIEWKWHRDRGSVRKAANCGIVGGNDISFLHHYATQALELLRSPRNRTALAKLKDARRHNPLFEQYFLCACADYHGVRVKYLFESFEEASVSSRSMELGYTHLLGNAKSNPEIVQRLEARVATDFPLLYERCQRLTAAERDFQL